MILIAGGLHYFYKRKSQETDLKYVARSCIGIQTVSFLTISFMTTCSTLVSGVAIWSGYEILMFWAMGSGYLNIISFDEMPIWSILALPAISLWISFHFYVNHRILHIKPLYDAFHSLHHRNVNVGRFRASPCTGLNICCISHRC